MNESLKQSTCLSYTRDMEHHQQQSAQNQHEEEMKEKPSPNAVSSRCLDKRKNETSVPFAIAPPFPFSPDAWRSRVLIRVLGTSKHEVYRFDQ